jgi:hypothetical protein
MAYTYNLPFSGFNPWATSASPAENPGYNYTMDPYYSAGQDQQKWDLAQTGPQSENNRARVWRWTLDQLRAQGYDPGKAPSNKVQQAYLGNIGRLRQDYANNGFDWNRSGFSGYDRFLATPPTSPQYPGGPPPVTPNGQPLPVDTRRTVNNGSGVIPNQGPSTPTVRPGNNAGGMPGPTAPKSTPPSATTTNPGMGGGGTLSGAGADVLNSDPNLAYQYMLRQIGWDPTVPSRFGDYLQKRFSPLLQARLAASQVGGGGQQGAYLDQFGNTVTDFGKALFQQGGDFYGNQAALADQVLQSQQGMDYLGGIQDQSQVQQYLNQLETLKYAGANPMIQQSIADSIQRAQQQYDWESAMQVNAGTGAGDPYLQWLRNNAKYNRYIGVR